LADLLIEKLKPLREKKEELKNNPAYVNSVLERGAGQARKRAEKTMAEVRKKMGLL